MQQYYGLQETAYRLHVSEKTLRRWIHQGQVEHRVDGKRYMIPDSAITSILARKDAGSYDVLAQRIEAVENELRAISDRLGEVERQRTIPLPTPAAGPATSTLRHRRAEYATRPGDTLPEGLIGWRQFAAYHNIAPSTVQRAVEAGRLPVQRGRWKVGRAIVEMALDATGQHRFIELFAANPGFKACNLCPHGDV